MGRPTDDTPAQGDEAGDIASSPDDTESSDGQDEAEKATEDAATPPADTLPRVAQPAQRPPPEGAWRAPDPTPTHASRWRLIRDAAAFQVKLLVDGIRDVLLSPLSLIATIAGLALGRHDWFYSLLSIGRRSERWIDLFSAADRQDEAFHSAGPDGGAETAGSPRGPGGTAHRQGPARPGSASQRRARRASRRQRTTQSTADASPTPLTGPAGPRRWYSDTRWRQPGSPQSDGGESIDDLIQRLEQRLQEQYQRGGVTARAKHTIDRMLDAVEKRYREGRRDSAP